jgi:hypothetical protein
MATLKKYISDQRMLKLIEILKTSGQIKFTQAFLDAIDMPKQNIRLVKLGEKHFTPEHIHMACKTYMVNANWIFGFEKDIYRTSLNVVKKK